MTEKLIHVIPLGTTVKVKNSSWKTTIKGISIADDGVLYRLDNITSTGERNLIWLRENELKGTFKKQGILSSLISDSESNPNLDIEAGIIQGVSFLVQNTTKGYLVPVGEKFVDTITLDNILPVVELYRSTSYGYLNDELVLPNDYIVNVYLEYEGEVSLTPDIILTRGLRLKSFYRRFINTIKYGRSHQDNFEVIESDKAYLERIIETLSNEPNIIKNSGFFLNKARFGI